MRYGYRILIIVRLLSKVVNAHIPPYHHIDEKRSDVCQMCCDKPSHNRNEAVCFEHSISMHVSSDEAAANGDDSRHHFTLGNQALPRETG